MELPALRWVVPDLITIGLTLFAGPPKIGKSNLLLNIALAVTQPNGGKALGTIPVEPSTVLYLALEDNQRRLRSRIDRLLKDDQAWPKDLHIVHAAPKIDAALLTQVEAWLNDHPDCRVVMLDTLARIRGKRSHQDDSYTNDSRVTETLQELAMRRDIAVILVHHVRKQPGIDIFETVSGTYGLTGPADTILIIERTRGEADAKLHVTGRDIEERELALVFNKTAMSWTILGDANHYTLSDERRAILDAIQASPGMKPKEISEKASLNRDSCRHLLIRLRDEGRLKSDAQGRYYPL